jgi:hypothetical protein
MSQKCQQGDIGLERKRPPTGAAFSILDAMFYYFNARLLQYQAFSELLQPTFSPSSMHAA